MDLPLGHTEEPLVQNVPLPWALGGALANLGLVACVQVICIAFGSPTEVEAPFLCLVFLLLA